MACVSTSVPGPVRLRTAPAISPSTTGTVLPPSFHPINSRSARDRGVTLRPPLPPELPMGVDNLAPGRPLLEGRTVSRGPNSTSGSRSLPVPVLTREVPGNPTTAAAMTTLNPAMLQHPLPVWNGLGILPMVSVDPLVGPSQLPAFGQWRSKQPIINRDYLELAMLVCNTFRGKLFPCPHCRYVTDRRNNLKRHIATMHETCEKVLECCGVVFQTKASLREHITIFHHNGYSCPYCGRRFCRKALLKRHLSVHSGRKDYSCPHCDYATSHKSNLERHKKIHERSVKSPLSDMKVDPDMTFLDGSNARLSPQSTTLRESSPAPPDSTVSSSAINLGQSMGKLPSVNDVSSDSDTSLSDEDVDVECG